MSSLLSLPTEILIIAFNSIAAEDDILSLVRASCCCRYLRALLVPLVFRRIAFTDDKASCESALAAARAHPQHLKCLHFTARTLPIAWPEEDYMQPRYHESRIGRTMVEDPDIVLHPAARDLLCGTHTPNVISLTIVHRPVVVDYPSHIYICQDGQTPYKPPTHNLLWQDCQDESQEWCHESEAEFFWLARLAAIRRSIATNSRLTHLKLHNMLPRPSSVVYEPIWQRFLDQLEYLEIAVPLGDTDGVPDSDLKLCDTDWGGGPKNMLSEKQWMSFGTAHNLRQLRLCGSAADGISRCLVAKLMNYPDCMPGLTSLRLETIYVDEDLAPWLVRHARTLRSLEMYNCWSDLTWALSDVWKSVFGLYADADTGPTGPVALRKITVYAGDCEDPDSYMPFYTPRPGEWPWHTKTSEGSGIANKPRGDNFPMKGRRFGPPASFLYGPERVAGWATGIYEGGWGSHIHPVQTREAWERQEDFREYERLVEIVERNIAVPKSY